MAGEERFEYILIYVNHNVSALVFYYENLYYFLAALIRLIVPQVLVYAFIRSTKYGVPLGPLSISHVRLYKSERVLSNKGERTIVIRCKGEGARLLF